MSRPKQPSPLVRFFWRGLSKAAGYDAFGRLIGGWEFRRQYIGQWIRPRPGDRVLDIGCGTGTILRFLPEVSYIGFDINEDYIQSAKKKHGARGTFMSCGVRSGLGGQFYPCDIVMANGLLHHLNDQECLELLQIAHRALRPGGRLVTLDGIFTPTQTRWERYFVARDRGRFVRSEAEYLALVRNVFPEITTEIVSGRLLIPYTHFMMSCRKGAGEDPMRADG